jgi:hypothetical protein
VKASNILFDADWRIQIADFSPIRLETGKVEPFSGEKSAPTADVSAFASICCDRGWWPATPLISAVRCPPLPAAVPTFVSRMIEDGRSPKSNGGLSFVDVVARLKANGFEIMAGADSDDVSAFVSLVESFEQVSESVPILEPHGRLPSDPNSPFHPHNPHFTSVKP